MKIWMKNYDNWWQLINWLLSVRIHYLWNEMHFVWDFGSTDQIWLKKRILLVTLLNPWVIEDNQLWCPQVPDRLEECRLECEAVNWVNQYHQISVTLLHTTIDWNWPDTSGTLIPLSALAIWWCTVRWCSCGLDLDTISYTKVINTC